MAPSRLSNSLPPSTLRGGRSTRPRVHMLDKYHPSAIAYCQKLFDTVLPDDPEFSNWRTDAEYLLVRSSYITAADIESCLNLKVIVRHGVGIDRIDAAACKARNITVLNTPGINSRSVAELVLALTMSVAREVPTISAKQSRGLTVEKEFCTGLLLHKKTVGIVGMGNIGKCVAQIFRGAFDANVIAYDPFAPANAWPETAHKRADTLEEVLINSDVLTLHIPLTPETRGLIAFKQLGMMKRTAIVINTARGGIIHETDLERALSEGLIWGAGLDCHETEPPTLNRYEKLWENRVASTPHIGATTKETVVATGISAVQRLFDLLKAEETNATRSTT